MTTFEKVPKTQKAIVSDSAEQGYAIKDINVVQPEELPAGQALVKVLYSGM